MEDRFKKILASAGGGKTHQLSERYIKLLKQNKENLKRTLAITFTNKAATEMKERILTLLKEDALVAENKHSKKLVEWILYNFSDFSVITIDSFINKLVKVFSIELGLSPQTELIFETRYYKEYAISKLIEDVKDNKKLQKLITEFLISMIEHKGKTYWGFKDIIMNGMQEIEEYENKLNQVFELPIHEASETDMIMTKLRRRAKDTITEILKLQGVKQYIHKNFFKKLNKGLDDINEILSSNKIKKECDSVLKKDATLNRDSFCNLFNKLKNIVFEYYVHKIFRNHNYHIHIYHDYKEILDKIKREERIRFIEDINSELKSLFYEFDIPFIYYRIGERYDHFLIDEFQDTSRSQWKNLEPLIENSLSEGGSFFFVGDPKQAIYQWRGGDVELFDEAFSSFSCVDARDKINEVVDINYRSGSEIVRFNNEVFSNLPDVMKEKMGEKANYYIEKNVKQAHYPQMNNFKGYISLKKIKTDSKNKEDLEKAIKTELINTIHKIKKRFANNEISILVRTNKQGKSVVDWLTTENISVISNESLYLSSNTNIKGLISFLKFLQHPIDDLAFFGFVTSPFFTKETKKSFKEMQRWVEGKSFDKKFQPHNYLYVLFREEYNIIWEHYIQKFFRNVGFLPLYDLINEVIKTFKIPENFPQSNPFLEGFLEFVHNLEKKSITSIELMMNEWERIESSVNPPSILLPESAEAIRVMTIHCAKGLEFPVVILPFLYFSTWERAKRRSEFVVEYEGIKRIGKLDKKELLPENDPELSKRIENAIEKRERDNSFEEVNNLYVAMTRAEKELHIFIPDEISSNYSKGWQLILKDFIEEEEKSYGIPEKGTGIKEDIEFLQIKTVGKESISEIESRLILKRNDIDSIINKKRKEALKLGDIAHRVLYYIRDIDDMADIENIIDRSLNEIVLPMERKIFKEKTYSIIRKLFELEDIKEWFTPGLNVWKEKEMIDRNGNLHRFDRVVFKKDMITLIDYKTGDEPVSSYKKQIETYKGILMDYFPGRAIESYILQLSTREVVKIE